MRRGARRHTHHTTPNMGVPKLKRNVANFGKHNYITNSNVSQCVLPIPADTSEPVTSKKHPEKLKKSTKMNIYRIRMSTSSRIRKRTL